MSNDGHSKIKILFVIHDLSVGGAEKVLINLVNNMDYLKFDVTVLALFDEGVNKQFLNSKIKYRYAFRHAIRGNSHYMKLLSPEGPSARIVAGCPKNKTKIVSWIHCTYHNKEELAKSFRDIKEAYKCYEKSDRMIFVSEEVKQAFIRYCPIKCETHVLYNTNESEKIIVKAAERIEEEKLFRIKVLIE